MTMHVRSGIDREQHVFEIGAGRVQRKGYLGTLWLAVATPITSFLEYATRECPVK